MHIKKKKKKNLSCHRAHIEGEEKKNESKKGREREKKDSLTEEASDGGKSEFHLH
jgi:hypothetical protein